jgi:LPS export ABC transporter protein LptC
MNSPDSSSGIGYVETTAAGNLRCTGIGGFRLLCVLAVIVALVSCSRTPREDLPSEAFEPEGPDQESWGAVYRLQEHGEPRLTIDAGYMARHETEDSTYTLMTPGSDSVQVEVFWLDASGEREGMMYSDRVYFYETDQRLVAEGNVVAIMGDSTRLETERLRWNREKEMLRAPGFARITTPTEQIQGYELTSDERLENYSLARVTGQVRIQEGND